MYYIFFPDFTTDGNMQIMNDYLKTSILCGKNLF